MKLNRKVVLVLALMLSVAMATTGTLAYLTDRATVENTFTMGNVDIDVEEEFEDGASLLPGVEVEKQAGIKNVHNTSDAWVWMTVSVPEGLVDYLELEWLEGYEGTKIDTVVQEGYVSYVVKYPEQLAPGESTPKFLQSVTLSDKVDYQDGKYVVIEGGEAVAELEDLSDVKVIVDGFAMQIDGFDTVDAAYDAYMEQWAGMTGGESGAEGGAARPPVTVDTAEELADALLVSGTINLAADVTAEDVTVTEDVEVDLQLDDNTLTGPINNQGGTMEITGGTLESSDYGLESTGTTTLTDVTMNSGSPSHYSNISRDGAVTTYDNVAITSGGGGVAAAGGAQVTFNSGSVAVNSASTSGRYVFYAQDAGSVITINGGTFSFSATLNQKRAYVYAGDGTTVYITGGTFGPASTRSGYTAGILTAGTGTVVITGGTFGFDPSTWVADGYTAVKSGSTWTVSAQ